ncbi:AMP-binding protein [Marmoricola sp. RAF53]|uniref:AMP-binding protein n=1 Tax=Marmoricola sp. RAF53 TaxID=3233059 RepID=UPI003F960BA1
MTIAHEIPALGGISDVGRHGDAPAVVLPDRVLSHRDLDALVEDRARLLGPVRRLVLVECAPELEPLVTYLAALRGGHPALLVPARSQGAAPGAADRSWDRMLASYRPDVVLRRAPGGSWDLDEVRPGTAHDLHPDLALLLGTSGSTGTPKLVRLSHRNLHANAAAIAAYLGLDGDSRAATTLPLQYCYGLSVVNSHLLVGGSLWLTGASVVDPGFWDDFARAGATSFAGVPYTFDLLAASGADWAATPGLRHVTQAGGRLAPDRVRELGLHAEDRGVDFFVMYGQTEATARMAYLPPHLAATRPSCVGVPIDGGEFRIEDGELVYTGPNVMLGYAHEPADLALGATLTELRTGDLAVQHDDGLYEIVGRANRIAKLFGTRLDLDHAELLLAEDSTDARVVADADALHVFVRQDTEPDRVGQLVRAEHCLPPHAVRVHRVDTFPVTAHGKPDRAALVELAAGDLGVEPGVEPGAEPADVTSAFAGVFGDVAPGDSFTSLRGDSLCYVELYVRLERVLGEVPADWPTLTVAELSARSPRKRRWYALLETPIVLRAVAICLIVAGHTDIVNILGGAHVLLIVLGYNITRFALDRPTAKARATATLAAARDIAIPCTLWVTGVVLVSGWYTWPTAVYLNGLLHPDHWTVNWRLWFLESAIWSLLALALVSALPPVDRLLRRDPFPVALAVLGAGLALRFAAHRDDVLAVYSVPGTAWLVALGWVVATARTTRPRVLVSLLVPLTLVGYFHHQPTRAAIVVAGAWLLLWVPRIPVPRFLQGAVALVASASLYIYLTHWQVYVPLKYEHPWLAFAASMTLGLTTYAAWTAGRRAVLRGAARGCAGLRGARGRGHQPGTSARRDRLDDQGAVTTAA